MPYRPRSGRGNSKRKRLFRESIQGGKAMKKVLIVFIAVVVLIVAGVVYMLSNLDSLVAKAIEKHGSRVTQTSVTVSGVELSLKEGRGSITGLRVESPEGFDVRDAFTLGDITLDIDIQSLRGEPVVIDEIRVIAPVVNVEIRENGASNIDELRKNVNESVGGSAGDGGDSGGKEKKIRIRRFVFEEGSIEVDASALGQEKRQFTLPEIRLDDIGGADGETPDEIAKIILGEVIKKAASEISGSGVKGWLKSKLGG
jgi:uncharacterized protein involved in outer membrane biogenesis